MGDVVWSADRLNCRRGVGIGVATFLLLCIASGLSSVCLWAQCPNDGQTKVFNSKTGTGYYFYKFLGEGSFRYFLEGKAFSYNDKDDPGKTLIFIDKMAYEPVLVDRPAVGKSEAGTDATEVLRAQAKQAQARFQTVDSSMKITDFGPASMKNPDGTDGRVFYLWKKESAPGKVFATQYLVSTLAKDGVFVMSYMLPDESISDGTMIRQIQNYMSHFEMISSDQCAQVLGMPVGP